MYEMSAWYIGVLHVVDILEIVRYGICMMDWIVRSKLEQLVVMFKMFMVNTLSITTSTNY